MLKINARFFVFLFLFSFSVSFRSVSNQHLKVTISRLHSNQGVVLVSLFKDGNGYPDHASKAIGKEKGYIVEKSSTIFFKNVAPGNYAIAILHDENNNQKMDKTILGIPKEGYGFSNNVSGAFGPPSFKKASFIHTASAPTEILIKAKYF